MPASNRRLARSPRVADPAGEPAACVIESVAAAYRAWSGGDDAATRTVVDVGHELERILDDGVSGIRGADQQGQEERHPEAGTRRQPCNGDPSSAVGRGVWHVPAWFFHTRAGGVKGTGILSISHIAVNRSRYRAALESRSMDQMAHESRGIRRRGCGETSRDRLPGLHGRSATR